MRGRIRLDDFDVEAAVAERAAGDGHHQCEELISVTCMLGWAPGSWFPCTGSQWMRCCGYQRRSGVVDRSRDAPGADGIAPQWLDDGQYRIRRLRGPTPLYRHAAGAVVAPRTGAHALATPARSVRHSMTGVGRWHLPDRRAHDSPLPGDILRESDPEAQQAWHDLIRRSRSSRR